MDITDNICNHLSIEERWMRIIISFINGYRIDFVSLCSWRPMLSVPIVMLRRLLCFRTQLWYIWQNEKNTPAKWICAVVISPSIGRPMRLKFSMSMNLKLNQTACSSYVSLKKHGMKSYEELKKLFILFRVSCKAFKM